MQGVTNKHFKRKPTLEKYFQGFNYLCNDVPFIGGRCVKMCWYVDLQKGGMPFYLLFLMWWFNNWSVGMCVYTALHGSYGVLWLIKSQIFPDPSFEVWQSLFCAIGAWTFVLAPYGYAGYMIASR